MLTIGELVKNNGRYWKHHDAYIEWDRRVTWGEFDARTDALGKALLNNGISAGDRVAILAADCIEVAELFVACAKIGAIRVGMNHRLSPREIRHILDDSKPSIVFVQESYSHLLKNALDGGLEEIGFVGFGGKHEFPEDYETWVAQFRNGEELVHNSREFLMIAYTTGSTGLPKGAIYTHDSMVQSMLRIALYEGTTHDDVWLHTMPAGGIPILHLCRNLYHACPTVILGAWDCDKVMQLIEREKVTITIMVPTMLNVLIHSSAIGKYDVSSLRLLEYGASPLPPASIRKAKEIFGCKLLQMYGATEMTGMTAMLLPSDHERAMADRPEILTSAGKPLSYVQVKIVDENGRELPNGEVGELLVKDDLIIPGYWNKPDEYAKTVVDGWLHTGDLAYLDDEGYIYLVDRLKFRIKSGGYLIYPIEIENVLAEHPSVVEVSVIGMPDERWGDRVHAVVVLKEGHAVNVDELKQFCNQKIADFKIPKSIDFWDKLPKGATGKILKREIVEHYTLNSQMELKKRT